MTDSNGKLLLTPAPPFMVSKSILSVLLLGHEGLMRTQQAINADQESPLKSSMLHMAHR